MVTIVVAPGVSIYFTNHFSSVHPELLSPIWPHGGGAGISRTPVWSSQSANSSGSDGVPVAATWGPESRHQHPEGGKNVPKRWKFHPLLLLPHDSLQTHLWFSGSLLVSFHCVEFSVDCAEFWIVFLHHIWNAENFTSNVSFMVFSISNVSIQHFRQWIFLNFVQLEGEEELKMKAKEDELAKVFQTAARLCVNKGLMTAETAMRYYRSGMICDCVCLLKRNCDFVLCGLSLAMDADLRFALEHHLESDIIKHCLVYIHKVINAKGQRPKTPKNSEPVAPSEVIHLFFFAFKYLKLYNYLICNVRVWCWVILNTSCMHASPHNLIVLKCWINLIV